MEAGEGMGGERRDDADRVVAQQREQVRDDEALLLRAERHLPRQVRAERDEADVAEGDHARVADEDVDRDHDRGLHERVLELQLTRRAREVPHDADSRHEHERSEQLQRAVDVAACHTRSTAARRKGANTPEGRRSSTTITSP